MNEHLWQSCTAFAGERRIARGPLGEVALALREALADGGTTPMHVYDDATGRIVDLDLRGDDAAVLARVAAIAGRSAVATAAPAKRGRGRPKLGVVGREVTLLPRHWDWLQSQPGGASVTLRKLVEQARRGTDETPRRATDAAYRVMSSLAGDRPGYEEALRALYAGEASRFAREIAAWPADIRAYVEELAAPAFAGTDPAA